jgi:hypothetical protein
MQCSARLRTTRARILACVLVLAGCEAADESRTAAPAQSEAGDETQAGAPTPDSYPLAYLFSPAVRRKTGPGNWRRARGPVAPADASPEQKAEFERLGALGYVTGSRKVRQEGVTVRGDPAGSGLNFYASGHGPEAVLVDMDGRELHRWRYPFDRAFPGAESSRSANLGAQWWCDAQPFENGDLLAIFSYEGLVKLNAQSELIWASDLRAHHAFAVLPDGSIYVLTAEDHVLPRLDPERSILEDFVTLLDAEGNVEQSFSLIEAFEGTEFDWIFDLPAPDSFGSDIFHTNALEWLDGRIADRHSAFREGNLLVSICTKGTIAVVDPRTEKVVWAHRGGWGCQHHPQVLDSGTILLFDNTGLGEESRVLEIDPGSKQVVWEYRGTPEQPFYSRLIGAAQRLPNSHTLITESEGGRAFEVTPDKEIVWEFFTPHRAGEEREFIATLCRVKRLPAGFGVAWWREPGPAAGSDTRSE